MNDTCDSEDEAHTLESTWIALEREKAKQEGRPPRAVTIEPLEHGWWIVKIPAL